MNDYQIKILDEDGEWHVYQQFAPNDWQAMGDAFRLFKIQYGKKKIIDKKITKIT